MSDPTSLVGELLEHAPAVTEAYDTSTPQFAEYVDRVERTVLAGPDHPIAEVDALVRTVEPGAIAPRVALKLVESRSAIRAVREPVVLTLLNPVYKETGRMQPRERHQHGEDSLRYKATALDRIHALNPTIETRLIVIDDGCPDRSGEMAAEILGALPGWEERHEVLFLERARQAGDPDVPPGLTAKDGPRRSVKGGAVLYGMRRALLLETSATHVIVDNDADLSVLPDQLGLLLHRIVEDGFDVVAGSRREDDSVALIGPSRAARGSLFIAIWQHLLPQLAAKIVDTNRAFKAFESHALRSMIDDIEVYTFPYQVEVLQAAVSRGIPLAPQAIAYVDSEAASTQQGDAITETYVDQIRQIVEIAHRYGTITPDDPLLRFLDGVDDDAWLAIEQDPPDELLEILAADRP